MLRVACIQLKSEIQFEKNVKQALRLANLAASRGANLIAYPEHFLWSGKDYHKKAEAIPGSLVAPFCELAKKKRIAFVLGSLPEIASRGKKVFNTSVVINTSGRFLGTYRKQKLFRAKMGSQTKRKVDETAQFYPGKQPKVFSLFGFRIGIAICFDLRFSDIFRAYQKKKVDILFVPSAFTYETGKDHWEVLLRARAIENQCYIVAPNQFGFNRQNRIRYFGKSLIIDPWGHVQKKASTTKTEILLSDIRKEAIVKVRQKVLMS